jgi:hypothetical protein
MLFEVNLIRVPSSLTPPQRDELEENCRHVDGRWWIFEGDDDALNTPIRVFAVGVTGGCHPDDIPAGQPSIDHAVDIFGLAAWPPALSRRGAR